MLLIHELLEKYSLKKGPGGFKGPQSELAEVIENVIVLMEPVQQKGETELEFYERIKKRFKYWLGRTRHLNPYDIFAMLSQAKGGKNPQALFNYLLKKSKLCKK